MKATLEQDEFAGQSSKPSKAKPGGCHCGRKSLGMLVGVVLVLGGVWAVREDGRVRERNALVAELERADVRPMVFGLTPPGAAAAMAFGFEGGKNWVTAHLGEGWFSTPAGFSVEGLRDDQVPFVTDRLRRLGTVHELHLRQPALSKQALAEIRAALPRASVVVEAPSTSAHVYRPLAPPVLRTW